MPVEIRRLDHAALLVKDVERSRRFYGQVLGMEEVPRPSNFTFPGTWFRKGHAKIHLIGEAEPGRAAQVQPGGYRPDELSVGYGAVTPGLHLGSTDRKSTRLNSSHQIISYAVFCLKKNKKRYHPSALRSPS